MKGLRVSWLVVGVLLVLLVAAIAACSPAGVEGENLGDAGSPAVGPGEEIGTMRKTLYVGAEQVDCVGVAPQKCLLVKENPDGDYLFFYDPIEGFDWVAGYEYEIVVEVETVDSPPADGSSLRYILVEVVSKKSVGD